MSAKFQLDGSAAGAIKAVSSVTDGLDKTGKAAEKVVAASQKIEERLHAQAQRIKESIDPQTKLNRLYAELGQHVRAGRLSMDEATTAGVKFRNELGLAAKAGDGALGKGLVSKADLATGAIGAVVTAVGLLKSAFQDAESEAQGIANAVINALGSAGELQQLGPAGFAANAGVARQLVRSGAVRPENLGQAFDIATNLANAGFSPAETNILVQDVAAQRIVKAENLESFGGALRKYQEAFGAADAGELRQVIDKTLVAAGETQADAVQTVTSVLKFASLAKSAGVPDEQALASFVGVEKVSPNEDAAAEYLKSFYGQVVKRGLAKGDLYGTIANIEQQIAGGKTVFEVLGEQNAVIGFQDLQRQLQIVRSMEGRIQQSGGALQERQGILRADPLLGPANAAAAEAGGLADVRLDLEARRENLFDAVRDAHRRQQIQRGDSIVTRAMFEAAFGLGDLIADEDFAIRRAQRIGRQNPGFFSDPSTQQTIDQYLEEAQPRPKGFQNAGGQGVMERIGDDIKAIRNNQHSRASTLQE